MTFAIFCLIGNIIDEVVSEKCMNTRQLYGGSVSSAVSALLTSGVKLICANEMAFTAIKFDGSAVACGNGNSGRSVEW